MKKIFLTLVVIAISVIASCSLASEQGASVDVNLTIDSSIVEFSKCGELYDISTGCQQQNSPTMLVGGNTCIPSGYPCK